MVSPDSGMPNRASFAPEGNETFPDPQNTTAPGAPGAPARPVVGIVGLGHMGKAFALNLIADGYQVLAYDRQVARIDVVRVAGGQSLQDLSGVRDCDVVLTSLPNDVVLKAVTLPGLVRNMRPGSVHVSMSTVSPALSQVLAAEHEKHGQRFVAAPVFGNPDLARGRRLFVVAGGEAAAIDRVRGVLQRLGERVFVVGSDPAAANLIKLAGNVLTATTMQSMAEVLTLLRKSGVDQRMAFDVLTNSLFDSKVHRTYGGKIVEERYSPPGMVVPLAIKDLRLALAEAEREGVPMPAATLVRDRLIDLLAEGGAGLDWSALGLLEAREAGLAPRPDPKQRNTHSS